MEQTVICTRCKPNNPLHRIQNLFILQVMDGQLNTYIEVVANYEDGEFRSIAASMAFSRDLFLIR